MTISLGILEWIGRGFAVAMLWLACRVAKAGKE